MTDIDTRCLPLVEVELDQVKALLSPLLKGRAITGIKRVEGGLTNSLYRVTLADKGMSLCLRVFAAGQLSWETERKILALVSASLPAPDVLLADCGRLNFSHPYLVYRWIEGITLNECRRQIPPAAFLSIAEPLGRLLATVASFSFPAIPGGVLTPAHAASSSMEVLLSVNEKSLQCGLARARLGSALANALWCRLEASAVRLSALDRATCLVHGDLSGRNIIVAPTNDSNWRISGLIDWEGAFSGSMLWDVGSLFRYATRYSEIFRQCFEQGYRNAGGVLPEDWWQTARFLDTTRLVATLNEERELPTVFTECRELIEAVVAEWV
jgi:aminoglycoside phosphotransferase (APT) family kinase protein